MQYQPNPDMGMIMNPEGISNTGANMNTAMSNPAQANPMAGRMANPTVYPEVFYKLQPYILLACDQMDALGGMMPSQEMAEQMTDRIYGEVCKTHPELLEYVRENERISNSDPADPADPPDPPPFGFGFGPIGFGSMRFRRRGMFRDLIEILLLQELFRRRRRPY